MATHCILIIDGSGNVLTWYKGNIERCVELLHYLPSNGWELYAIKSLI